MIYSGVVVAHDLDAVAPRIEKIQEPAGQRLDARGRERLAHRLLVVDHEAEMTPVIAGLPAALLQGEELIAKIDEGGVLALASQLEIRTGDRRRPAPPRCRRSRARRGSRRSRVPSQLRP